MRAQLKGYYTVDVHEDLGSYNPATADFSYLLRLLIGSDESAGADEFYIRVCTPAWISRRLSEVDPPILDGKHYLIVPKHDIESIIAFVNSHLATIEGEDWSSIAREVNTFAQWEYA